MGTPSYDDVVLPEEEEGYIPPYDEVEVPPYDEVEVPPIGAEELSQRVVDAFVSPWLGGEQVPPLGALGAPATAPAIKHARQPFRGPLGVATGAAPTAEELADEEKLLYLNEAVGALGEMSYPEFLREKAGAAERGLEPFMPVRHGGIPAPGPKFPDLSPAVAPPDTTTRREPFVGHVQKGTRGLVPPLDILSFERLGAPYVAAKNIIGTVADIPSAIGAYVAERVHPQLTPEGREAREQEAVAAEIRRELVKRHDIREPQKWRWEVGGPLFGWKSDPAKTGLVLAKKKKRPTLEIIGPGAKPSREDHPTPISWDVVKNSLINSWKFVKAFPAATLHMISSGTWVIAGPDPAKEKIKLTYEFGEHTVGYFKDRAQMAAKDPVGFIDEGLIQAGIDVSMPFAGVRSAAQRMEIRAMRNAMKEAGDKLHPDLQKLIDANPKELVEGLIAHRKKVQEAKAAQVPLVAEAEGLMKEGADLVARFEVLAKTLEKKAHTVPAAERTRLAARHADALRVQLKQGVIGQGFAKEATALRSEIELLTAELTKGGIKIPRRQRKALEQSRARTSAREAQLAAASARVEAAEGGLRAGGKKAKAALDRIDAEIASIDARMRAIADNDLSVAPAILSDSPFYAESVRLINVIEGRVGRKSKANVAEAERSLRALLPSALEHDLVRYSGLEFLKGRLARKRATAAGAVEEFRIGASAGLSKKARRLQKERLAAIPVKRRLAEEVRVKGAAAKAAEKRALEGLEGARRAGIKHDIAQATAQLGVVTTKLKKQHARVGATTRDLRVIRADFDAAKKMHAHLMEQSSLARQQGRAAQQMVADELGVVQRKLQTARFHERLAERRLGFAELNARTRIHNKIFQDVHFWRAIQEAADVGGRLANPLWGPFEIMNRIKNKAIAGEGYIGVSATWVAKKMAEADRAGKAYPWYATALDKAWLRSMFRDVDLVVPEFARGQYRAGQALVDEATFYFRSELLKMRESLRKRHGYQKGDAEWVKLLPTIREGIFFEHHSMTKFFQQHVNPKNGTVTYDFLPTLAAAERTPHLIAKLKILNTHAAPLAKSIRQRVTDFGLAMGAFTDPAAIAGRTWLPQVYKQLGVEGAIKTVEHSITGQVLEFSRLRAKGVPIEARETPKGTLINEKAEWFTSKTVPEAARAEMLQRNAALRAGDKMSGGYGMSTDFVHELLVAVPDAVKDFANMQMFKNFADPKNGFYSMTPRPGWRKAPKALHTTDILPTGMRGKPVIDVNWGALSKGEGYIHPDLYWFMVNQERFSHAARSGWGRLLNYWKGAKTIDAPGTHWTNFISNALVLAPAAGISIYNPANWGLMREAAKALVLGADSPIYRELVLAGGKGLKARVQRADLAAGAESAYGILMQSIFVDPRKGGTAGVVLRDLNDAARLVVSDVKSWSGTRVGERMIERLSTAKGGLEQAAHLIQNNLGALYESGDFYWRLVKFIELRRKGVPATEAAQVARKAFADYENLAGFFNVVRQSWWGIPFIAFDARTIPQFAKFLRENPLKANMHLVLHDYLTNLNMAKSGIDFDNAEKHIKGYEDALPWYQKSTAIPWAAINPDAGFSQRGGVKFAGVTKYVMGTRFLPIHDELQRWDLDDLLDMDASGGAAREYIERAIGGNGPLSTIFLVSAGYDPHFKQAGLSQTEKVVRLLDTVLPNMPLIPWSYSWKRVKAAEDMTPRYGRLAPETPRQAGKAVWLGLQDFDYTLSEMHKNAERSRLRSLPRHKAFRREFDRVRYNLAKKVQALRNRLEAGKGRAIGAMVPQGVGDSEFVDALYSKDPHDFIMSFFKEFEPERKVLIRMLLQAGEMQKQDLEDRGIDPKQAFGAIQKKLQLTHE